MRGLLCQPDLLDHTPLFPKQPNPSTSLFSLGTPTAPGLEQLNSTPGDLGVCMYARVDPLGSQCGLGEASVLRAINHLKEPHPPLPNRDVPVTHLPHK